MKVNSSKKEERRKPNKALAAGLCLACTLAAGSAAFFGWREYELNNPEGWESPEILAAEFIDATYADDIDAIVAMMAPEFKDMMYENASLLYGADGEEPSNELFHKGLGSHLLMLDAWSGVNRHTEYEVGDYYRYTDEEKEAVQVLLTRCNISRKYKIDEYGLVHVPVSVVSDKNIAVYLDGTEPDRDAMDFDIYVPVLRRGHSWFLAQYIGAPAGERGTATTDIYGDLLDGFVIDPGYDEYGHEILYLDDGTAVSWDQEYGSYSYTDRYSNTHYCTAKLRDTKVVGPDGGKPLTEETYAQWWIRQLEEAEAADEAEHERYYELHGED